MLLILTSHLVRVLYLTRSLWLHMNRSNNAVHWSMSFLHAVVTDMIFCVGCTKDVFAFVVVEVERVLLISHDQDRPHRGRDARLHLLDASTNKTVQIESCCRLCCHVNIALFSVHHFQTRLDELKLL